MKKFVTASDSGVLRVWALPGDPEYAHLFKEDTGKEVTGAMTALNVVNKGASAVPTVLAGGQANGAVPPALPGMAGGEEGPSFPTTGGYNDLPAPSAAAGWKKTQVGDAALTDEA